MRRPAAVARDQGGDGGTQLRVRGEDSVRLTSDIDREQVYVKKRESRQVPLADAARASTGASPA